RALALRVFSDGGKLYIFVSMKFTSRRYCSAAYRSLRPAGLVKYSKSSASLLLCLAHRSSSPRGEWYRAYAISRERSLSTYLARVACPCGIPKPSQKRSGAASLVRRRHRATVDIDDSPAYTRPIERNLLIFLGRPALELYFPPIKKDRGDFDQMRR